MTRERQTPAGDMTQRAAGWQSSVLGASWPVHTHNPILRGAYLIHRVPQTRSPLALYRHYTFPVTTVTSAVYGVYNIIIYNGGLPSRPSPRRPTRKPVIRYVKIKIKSVYYYHHDDAEDATIARITRKRSKDDDGHNGVARARSPGHGSTRFNIPGISGLVPPP